MININSYTIGGRIVEKSKTGKYGNGDAWASFTIVTSRWTKPKNGDFVEHSYFQGCLCSGYTAEKAAKLVPGQTVVAEGDMRKSTKEGGGTFLNVTNLQTAKAKEQIPKPDNGGGDRGDKFPTSGDELPF